MSFGQHGATSAAAYRPTSLDFINHPNPIEPSAGSQRHPLNGTPRLDKARLDGHPNPVLFHLLLDSTLPVAGPEAGAGERPEKRQKVTDNTLLDLPKLPVRNAAKRLRIPPTLSGLHQPPPDAGLLPSINVEKPHRSQSPRPTQLTGPLKPSPKQPTRIETTDSLPFEPPDKGVTQERQPKTSNKRSKRNKWTTEETRCLLRGVARFGIGNWTKILRCPDLEFNRRTALDLKDRFRVCRPADYKGKTAASEVSDSPESSRPLSSDQSRHDNDLASRGPVSDRISTSELKKLGINEPFTKSSRRQRHGYTVAEDEALLTGFRKYGNSWAAIRADPSLHLSSRTATDLRDRFRTKYPREYGKAGLALKHVKLSTRPGDPLDPVDASTENGGDPSSDASSKEAVAPIALAPALAPDSAPVDNAVPFKHNAGRKPPAPALFALDDIFLGANFGIDEAVNESEPIVLDRGILDWAAGDGLKSLPADSTKNGGIDPLMTLKLPKLASPSQSHGSGQNSLPAVNGATSLPSLATMVSAGNPPIESSEPLGLPPLVQWLDTTENDGRTGTAASGLLSLDELLS